MSHIDAKPIGTQRRVAYALAIYPEVFVRRATIRAMLPPGQMVRRGLSGHLNRMDKFGHGSNLNKQTEKFQRALYVFNRNGWIDRGTEFVKVKDRDALWECAVENIPIERRMPAQFLSLEQAVDVARTELWQVEQEAVPSVELVEARRQELIVLQTLMTDIKGNNWSGKGSVRFVPKGKVL